MTMMAMIQSEGGSDRQQPDAAQTMRDMMGPGGVDQMIRQAITHCWMVLPPHRRSAQAVAAEIQRLVDRALQDLAQDASAFGFEQEK
jgi:hypothetical protein